ncbi:WYL domain-containing protein [Soehngenia saccharolytica]|nr:WYL domain-containing protein [Soehngenia saccharolytica]
MSRVSNAINMVKLLNKNGPMKVKDLARELEVSERMIKTYKEDLEKSGFYICSKSGPDGGYYLDMPLEFSFIGITKEEIDTLKMVNELIKSKDYPHAPVFERFTYKILNYTSGLEEIKFFSKNVVRPNLVKEKELKAWEIINNAITKKKKLKIKYKPLEKKADSEKTRIVHPYGVFEHDLAVYFFGYCELRKDLRYFKLSRIQQISILDERFKVDKKININEKLNSSFGIINDELIKFKVEISYPFSQLVKERGFSKDYSITDIDEDKIIYEAEMTGYKEIKSWILSMGKYARVIEPIELREEIKKDIEYLNKIYN